MSEYDNTNRGALFKNKNKSAENSPEYKGSVNVAGTEYWLSAWIKKSKAGESYMSLSVETKDGAPAKPAKRAEPQPDEDLPF